MYIKIKLINNNKICNKVMQVYLSPQGCFNPKISLDLTDKIKYTYLL